MQRKLMTVYRGILVILFVMAVWAVWTSAQETPVEQTNTVVPPVGTNTPVVLVDTNATLLAASSRSGLASAINDIEKKLVEEDVLFQLHKIPILKNHHFLGQPLWKYCSSLIFIVLAFYVSKLLDFLIGSWLKRWAAKTDTKFDDLLLEALHGPVKVVAFVIFLHIGLAVFQWPGQVRVYLSKGLIIVVAFSITYVSLKMVDLFTGLWRGRLATEADKSFNEQLFNLVRKSLKVFLVIVAVLLTAENLHMDVKSALASLSIGGLALGLAAQDTLSNLFGAIAIFMDKPFHIGDRIQLDSVDGVVESIGVRSTRVRNLDGHHVTVPNKTMGNAIIVNVTRRPNIKTEMNIGLTYDLPMEKVKRAIEILREIYKGHPNTDDLLISFNKFADSALNIMVVHWWKGTDPRAQLAGMQELNLQIKERFDAEGIGFAFPSQTVYLKQDSEWNLKNTGIKE